jgi:hypothetical protein
MLEPMKPAPPVTRVFNVRAFLWAVYPKTSAPRHACGEM